MVWAGEYHNCCLLPTHSVEPCIQDISTPSEVFCLLWCQLYQRHSIPCNVSKIQRDLVSDFFHDIYHCRFTIFTIRTFRHDKQFATISLCLNDNKYTLTFCLLPLRNRSTKSTGSCPILEAVKHCPLEESTPLRKITPKSTSSPTKVTDRNILVPIGMTIGSCGDGEGKRETIEKTWEEVMSMLEA